jgi:hypothetical protein
MALELYSQEDGDSYQIDNVDRRITAFHDTSDGSYYLSFFYIKSSDSSVYGYENIFISVVIDEDESKLISDEGIVYKIVPIDSNEDVTPQSLAFIPASTKFGVGSLPLGVEKQINFVLCTYVPAGHGAKHITNAKLSITAVEILD